jgi:hypothetical protein
MRENESFPYRHEAFRRNNKEDVRFSTEKEHKGIPRKVERNAQGFISRSKTLLEDGQGVED